MWRAVVFALAGLGVARTVQGCEPIWLPSSAPAEGGFVIATLSAERAGPGVRAEVERAGGAAAPYAGRSVVLVPWSYAPDCTPRPWREGAWAPAGTRGVFRVLPRPRASWIDEWPTFDVRIAGLEPVWRNQDPRWTDAATRGSLLAVEEFFSLYGALPDADALKRSPATAISRLEEWERGHPGAAEREPAKTIIEYLKGRAARK